MKSRFFVFAVSVFVIAGCTENALPPSSPGARFSADPDSKGAVQSINGNADIDVDEGLRKMEIHAQKSADGTVTGTWVIRQQWGNQDVIEADITCFTIVDNRAYVGALLKAVNGVPTVGRVVLRNVMVDNGEGANAAPDQSSQILISFETFQPGAFCFNHNLVLPLFDLQRGNLQIRP